MDKSKYITGPGCLGLILSAVYALPAHASSPVVVNNYVIPAAFASALEQGMTIPVFIRYSGEATSVPSRQKIADAILSVRDGEFIINQVSLSDLPNRTELATQLKNIISELKDARFSHGNTLVLNNDASISLDTRSFYLELVVSKAAMDAAIIPRTNLLAESSADNISNILNYTVGSYYNQYDNDDNASSYISLDNSTALREHHFNLNGSVYGLGTSDNNSELYRAMYERDFQGHRMALGMVDTWNLQSIASMSALNSSRIYGASFGNKSSTRIEDNTLSLIPITVFLPAAGEVHITRDGKLLSIQNFAMGNYEIDTSRLPFGVYDVEVQVIVNGKVMNSRTAQINKTFARESSVTGGLDWQAFGGMLEYNKIDYRNHDNIDYGEKETWIAGVAMGTSLPVLAGVNINSTLYGFDSNGVNEAEFNVRFNDWLSLNQQTLLATDSSWQSISSLNLSLPGGYGNIWGSRQFGHVGNKLPIYQGDYFTLGASTNLNNFVSWLGNISVSRTDDRYNDNKYTNVDYNQSLFSNRWVSVSMRAGIQRYHYRDSDSLRDKYVSLDISLPLSSWFSAGLSNENGNMLANASLRRSFDDSAITQVGTSVSKRIKRSDDDNGYPSDDFAINSYASYDAKYNAGTVSVTRSSENNLNYTLNSQGSIAWTNDSFNLAKGTERSGVVINTHFTEEGRMTAQINGRNYPLTGKSNYISLPPYAEYNVELMNDKTSLDSVDITRGRRSQIVLYPGNVTVITPEVKQLVTVFGRVKAPGGAVYANMDLQNHIGKTQTNEHGEFAMDVDKRYPVITLTDSRGGICETDLNLQQARGAIWIGDIHCLPQSLSASNSGAQANVY